MMQSGTGKFWGHEDRLQVGFISRGMANRSYECSAEMMYADAENVLVNA